MYSEQIFTHYLRHRFSNEQFGFVKQYVETKTKENVFELLTDLLSDFKKIKSGKADVSVKVVKYDVVYECIKDLIKILPDETTRPSELLADSHLLYKTIGTIIKACIDNAYFNFKANQITIKDDILPKEETALKKTSWNDPSELISILKDRISVNDKMMKNLNRIRKETPEKMIDKLEILCKSIHETTYALVDLVIESICAFANALEHEADDPDFSKYTKK